MDGRPNRRNKAAFSQRISVNYRPNRRNKAAFSLRISVNGSPNRRNKAAFSIFFWRSVSGAYKLNDFCQRWFKFDILTGEGQLTYQRGSGLEIPSAVLFHTSQKTSQPIKQDKWEKQELGMRWTTMWKKIPSPRWDLNSRLDNGGSWVQIPKSWGLGIFSEFSLHLKTIEMIYRDPQLTKFSFDPSRNLNKCFVTTESVSVYTSASVSSAFVARMKPSSSISRQK